MDELRQLRELRAELPPASAETRARARGRLVADSEAAPLRPRARRSPRWPGRQVRLIALGASAAALAAVVVVLGVFSSGNRVESAAAVALRETAAVAAAVGGPTPVPEPGEFLYKQTKSTELQEWVPGQYTGTYGGVISRSGPPMDPFSAFVTSVTEEWMSRNEPSRIRSVMDSLHFLSSAERPRWKAAGSPLPGPLTGKGEKRGFPGAQFNEVRRGVLDVETLSGHGFRDFSTLPRQPKALRLEFERRQGGGSVDTGQVIAELWDILDKPNGTPALRAALYGALSELPDIELNRKARDLVGRSGYAIVYERSGGRPSEYQLPGVRVEYIFDPETSELLGKRSVVADPGELPWTKVPPAGTALREVAYLGSAIVDSPRERPGKGSGGPIATASQGAS